MKYSPKSYARAFADAAAKPLSAAEEKRLIDNFIACIKKNGDLASLAKILQETERVLREKTGRRKVVIETARPLEGPLRHALKKEIVKPSDVVWENVNPSLIAGVKITVDDEREWDGSLRRKVEKLFSMQG